MRGQHHHHHHHHHHGRSTQRETAQSKDQAYPLELWRRCRHPWCRRPLGRRHQSDRRSRSTHQKIHHHHWRSRKSRGCRHTRRQRDHPPRGREHTHPSPGHLPSHLIE